MNINVIKAGGVRVTYWIIRGIGECVYASRQSDRVLRDKPAHLRVVETGAVVVEAGVGVEFTTGEGVARQVAAGAIAEGIVSKLLGDGARIIR